MKVKAIGRDLIRRSTQPHRLLLASTISHPAGVSSPTYKTRRPRRPMCRFPVSPRFRDRVILPSTMSHPAGVSSPTQKTTEMSAPTRHVSIPGLSTVPTSLPCIRINIVCPVKLRAPNSSAGARRRSAPWNTKSPFSAYKLVFVPAPLLACTSIPGTRSASLHCAVHRARPPFSTIRACVSRLPILHYRDIAFRPVFFHPISPPSPPSQYALSIHHPLATIRPLCPLRAARICPRAPSSSSSSARSPCYNTHYPLSPIRTCVFRPRVKLEMTVPVRRASVNAPSC